MQDRGHGFDTEAPRETDKTYNAQSPGRCVPIRRCDRSHHWQESRS
jgi:hypothetical protein